ncbi:MAG: hypothetical protein EXX96DRAFT_144853 [Benjaminiella poitrasii]|nr:MAG: hypothetical protein EXX96DRAFT_144853 [Benjaminiella poitrasii]
MDARYNQLVLISKRMEKANEKINEIINKLGWTRADLRKWHSNYNKLVKCPFDKRHVVPEKSMRKHYRLCLLKNRGMYSKKSLTVSEKKSTLFFYEKAPSVISLLDDNNSNNEEEDKEEPILTSIEKGQIYDELIQRSKQIKLQRQQ